MELKQQYLDMADRANEQAAMYQEKSKAAAELGEVMESEAYDGKARYFKQEAKKYIKHAEDNYG